MEAIKFNNYYTNLGYLNYPFYDNIYTYKQITKKRDIKSQREKEELIESIKKSIESEKKDEEFYKFLLSLTVNQEDIKIINSIISDERKHKEILREIYFELTDNKLEENREENAIDNFLNYKRNLKKAFFGELDAVKRYRNIMKDMPDKDKYSSLMEILTDELRHANLYNFLITKNMQIL